MALCIAIYISKNTIMGEEFSYREVWDGFFGTRDNSSPISVLEAKNVEHQRTPNQKSY